MLMTINVILLIILTVVLAYLLIHKLRIRSAATIISENKFREGMQKAQVVDVRESSSYKLSHIMGARNIPINQFRESMNALRKDRPIYLYENSEIFSGKAAIILKKAGYTNIYILKKGFSAWKGKIKKQKTK